MDEKLTRHLTALGASAEEADDCTEVWSPLHENVLNIFQESGKPLPHGIWDIFTETEEGLSAYLRYLEAMPPVVGMTAFTPEALRLFLVRFTYALNAPEDEEQPELSHSLHVLRSINPSPDFIDAGLEHLRSLGGFCDVEVELNVLYNVDEEIASAVDAPLSAGVDSWLSQAKPDPQMALQLLDFALQEDPEGAIESLTGINPMETLLSAVHAFEEKYDRKVSEAVCENLVELADILFVESPTFRAFFDAPAQDAEIRFAQWVERMLLESFWFR